MEDLAVMISGFLQVMKFEMTLWGFTVSWWQIALFGMVASVILYVIGGFFNG